MSPQLAAAVVAEELAQPPDARSPAGTRGR